MIVVPKKENNSKRICIDFRKLNEVTITEKWPLPNILDILDRLRDSCWFTVIDLKSGYWQVAMDESSISRTAFSTPDGHYEFLRLPFGLKNAPTDFSRIMKIVLGDLKFVECYIDDITIHSKTFEEHIEHILAVFERLREANLRINFSKCKWCAKEVKILGHIISENIVKMDPEKIEAIVKRKRPRKVKELQEFLGLPNFYRRFIKGYSQIAHPLFHLLAKDVKFDWSPECEEAFNGLKKALTSHPVLRIPDLNRPFKVYADASFNAVAGLICQVDDNGDEYIVACYSRLLKKREQQFTITEKECLAGIEIIKKFHYLLHGNQFDLIIDHSALKWLKSIKNPTGRLTRWSIFLQEYDFNIIHKPGKTHTNADALSRPVIDFIIDVSAIDLVKNSNDPWEDEVLLHFIKHKTFPAGIESKYKKRIKNLAKNFEWKDSKLYLIRHNRYLEVPMLEDRRKLIENAHSFGHFQAESTYNRLKEDYYWKNMVKEIKRIIKQCQVCARNNKIIIKYHPALATKIDRIFRRVSIDLVFGFDMSVDGYIGICVIIEFLSKFPFAKAIKTKEMQEIVAVLIEYISLFGPFDELLSDQGKEFCNILLAQLKNAIGFKHITTSAYNPRTNGITERFNQTLVEALRKQAEADRSNWPKYLPFTLMAYRSRVHSSTNYTPFELMFGRKVNQFLDLQSVESDANAIAERANELKRLVEQTHPEVIERINANQEKQKETQNNEQNTVSEKIEIGKTVYLKCEGLLSKLEPRFKGPYKIIGYTKRGNYKVSNALNETLPETFPRQKIKVVDDNENLPEDSAEIDRILKHKIEGNKYFFLVKWKDLPVSESSWIPEDHFNDMKLVNEYKKQISTNPELINTRPKRGRKPRSINLIVSLLIFSFFFIPQMLCQITEEVLIDEHESIIVKDEFQYCSNALHNNMINLKTLCQFKSKAAKGIVKKYLNLFNSGFTTKTTTRKLFMFSKSTYQVYGNGYHCLKKKHTLTTSMSFWGEKFESLRTTNIKLNRQECINMVTSKKCGDYDMECDGDYCSFSSNPVPDFQWMSDLESFSYSCVTSPKLITAKSPDEHLFNTKCKVMDKMCLLHDSIIVWDSHVYHECPLYQISQETFTVHDNNDVLLSTNNIGLQGIEIVDLCGLKVLQTIEGIYVSVKTNNLIAINVTEGAHIEEMKELLIAENDYKTAKDIEEKNELLMRECLNFKSILRIFGHFEEEVLNHYLIDGSRITLYATMGTVYKVTCSKIKEIHLFTNTKIGINSKECFRDQPVSFMENNVSKTGFLIQDGNIKLISGVVPCDRVFQYIQLPNLDQTVMRLKNATSLISDSQLQYSNIDYLANKIKSTSFSHNTILMDSIDLLSTFQEVVNHEMSAGTWYTHMSDTSNIKSKLIDTKIAIENNINFILNNILYGAIITGSLIILTIILIVTIKIIICCRKNKSKLRAADSREILTKRKRKLRFKDDMESEILNERPAKEILSDILSRSHQSLNSITKKYIK